MDERSQIRVLTLDATPLVHCGVRQMLSAFDDIRLVGEAADLDDAIALSASCAPEIALVEIADLGPAWAAELGRIARSAARPRVVVFTAAADRALVREAVRAGAQGFLLKNLQPMTLAQAVRGVAAGHQIFAPEVTYRLMAEQPQDLPGDIALSTREAEVLALLVDGLSNPEIAARLCLSKATVKFHCGRIYLKLGVSSRAQAIVKAYAHQLIALPPAACEVGSPRRGVANLTVLARSA